MQTVKAPLLVRQKEESVSADTVERLRDELELVSYVTSHDLQAPLRIILKSCEELNAHPDLSTDKVVRDALQTLDLQALRMKALLEGLLEYMRLETFVVKQTVLDGNEIVAASMAALEEEIKTTGAVITCDTMPQIFGHRGRLTRLFAFLLENALKFHGSQPTKIHISTRRMAEKWEFCVEDNGIGINEEHHAIIFALFQRLHTDEAYPGIGVGLALSHKIVESHGGKLWVESAPGKGSRFFFTLPAAT
jgi:chemotaxis family two-component system sensor kinase Cph1